MCTVRMRADMTRHVMFICGRTHVEEEEEVKNKTSRQPAYMAISFPPRAQSTKLILSDVPTPTRESNQQEQQQQHKQERGHSFTFEGD